MPLHRPVPTDQAVGLRHRGTARLVPLTPELFPGRQRRNRTGISLPLALNFGGMYYTFLSRRPQDCHLTY